MSGAHNFVQDLALIFIVATAAMLIFGRLRQPPVLGYLLAGLVVGPHTPIPIYVETDNVQLISELGVILVIFSIGLEFNLSKIARRIPSAGVAGAVEIASMISFGFVGGQIAGWSSTESLFLGGVVGISSTVVASRAVRAAGDQRVTDNVLGLLIVQDLVAVLLIAILTAVAEGAGMPPLAVLGTLGELALFFAGALIVGLLVVPRSIREADRTGGGEALLVASIGVCFGFALLAERLGYSVALGAFIAGTVIAESGRRQKVEHVVAPVRDLFAAVFFVSIGMLVDFRAIADGALAGAAITALVLIAQPIVVFLGSLLVGRSVGVAVRSGMALAQIGEFSFIIVGVGVAAGAVPSRLLAIAVGVSVVTTFLTPFMVAISEPVARFAERKLPHRFQTLVALHGAWIESLRPSRDAEPGAMRRHVIFLAIDFVMIVAAIIATALWRDELARVIRDHLGLSPSLAAGLAAAALLAVTLPFIIGLARTSRRLALLLAIRAVPRSEAGVDLGAAPRGALIIALEIGVILVVLLPLLALSLPFLPLSIAATILALTLAALGVAVWRSAANLYGHVRAGAELVLEVLDRQRAASPDEQPDLPDILPGLGPLEQIEIEPGSPAAGRTLRELDLRGLTGATVMSINRAIGGGVAAPTGAEPLAEGDLLTVTGSSVSIDRARRLLAGLDLDDESGAAGAEPRHRLSTVDS